MGAIGLASIQAAANPELDPQAVEFFEKKVRPVLVEHCYKCHSAETDKVKGGLLLDNREALLKGGDNGPAIVPGKPDESLLIRAVRFTDENLQMPPKKQDKLSPEQIADLEEWVRMGAPDPRSGAAVDVKEVEFEKARQHWAFQPPKRSSLPEVRNKEWVQSPIDAFVLAKLEEKGMSPAPQADRRTLIRRAYIDVIGLPPTKEEIDDFEKDPSPDAFVKVVERLLSSPQYGERWARHWLDVARYADTKGYVFEEERRYPYAYTYRDYVIRAFNEDLPFDQFLVQQLAADLLPMGEDKRALAGLGYLTLGRRFLNNQHDIIDDRIDVMTRGMMGLTVTCARCHDHKFDPVSIQDYYSLYGVFASTSEPAEKPLLGVNTANEEAYKEYLVEKKKRDDELATFRSTKTSEALTEVRQRTGDYLLTALEGKKLNDASKTESVARERKLDPETVRRWIAQLDKLAENKEHPIFAPWFALAALSEDEFKDRAKEICEKFAAEDSSEMGLNPLVAQAFAGDPPASMKEVAERYGKLFKETETQWQELQKSAKDQAADQPKATTLPEPDREALRQVLYAEESPTQLAGRDVMRLFDVPTAQKVRALQRKVEELDATHAGAPPRAMAIKDNSSPSEPHVFLRGNPGNRGPAVPRQFLKILSGEKQEPFKTGSGRLEMAEAIASKDNPLTARVFVNRVWLRYFGSGLVRTPSDFGLRCDPPSHPELLDYLACRFMDEGWSVKKLHRMILLSSVYQQNSNGNPDYAQTDPNNTLLWKMSRRRLDFEAMRDAMLAVSGKLDLAAGGHSVDITTEPFTTRRTVYSYIERQNLPGIFRTFDLASPDTTSPQRFSTTVPQQALFMLNSPFVIQLARSLLNRPEMASLEAPEAKVRRLYEIVLQREPSELELKLAANYLEIQSKLPPLKPEVSPWQYGYGKFDTNSQRVAKFQLLPFFTGEAWQGSAGLPDKDLGWVSLNGRGGHPGKGDFAAIRRWVAPRDMTITVSGTLNHESDSGDGVLGRLVSNQQGELKSWGVKKSKEETRIEKISVKEGETLDFVLECREDENSDSFTWAPVLKEIDAADGKENGAAREWNARADFGGPKELPKPLNDWEKYAQVLLMSNELAFQD